MALAGWFKDYSVHSLLVVVISAIAWVAYERAAYETKLSLKDEIIRVKEEQIAQLEKSLAQERSGAAAERARTTLHVQQMNELFVMQLKVIGYTDNLRFKETNGGPTEQGLPP